MSARAALATLIGDDSQLNMLGFEESDVYGPNAIDTVSRERNFIVVRWEEAPRAIAGRSINIVTVWVHSPKEKSRDYGVIDTAIARLQELITGVEHRAGSDGWSLTEATFNGASGDLFDDGYSSLCRWVRFRCACREVT